MKISALSKRKFDTLITDLKISDDNVEQYGDKYFISISHSLANSVDDIFDDTWKPIFKMNHKNVLNLFFDDVTEDKRSRAKGRGLNDEYRDIDLKAFTVEQAKETLNFLKTVIPNENNELIIHCAMGASRSVAIAEFAATMFGQNPDFINAKIDRKANHQVLKLLKELEHNIV